MRRGDEPCRACFGGIVSCKGGGNTRCWRRNPKAAHIAIILDTYGGARTIVADRESLKANVRFDELVHVVPDLIVHEPIAWGDIPIVIERARIELERWLETRPNLDELQHEIIKMYRIRQLRSGGTIDLNEVCET